MPLFAFEGLTPRVDPSAFVAPTATLVGDVIVEAGASIWYGAVIRADYAPVIVRTGANVQDGAVLHGPPGLTTDIGRGATVGPQLRRARRDPRRRVPGGQRLASCSTPRASGPVRSSPRARSSPPTPRSRPGMLAAGSPAVVKRPIEGSAAQFWVDANPTAYVELASRHRRGVTRLDSTG